MWLLGLEIKGQSRLHLLRKLRSFGVHGALLTSFYDSVVASAIFYGVVCWSSSISAANRREHDKVIKKVPSWDALLPSAGGGREQDDG